MPLSRPIPDVASGTHELRVTGTTTAVRVFCFLKVADAILVFHAFQKKTQKTPKWEMALGQQRLKEVLHGNVLSTQVGVRSNRQGPRTGVGPVRGRHS